jgi:hypothetical protein
VYVNGALLSLQNAVLLLTYIALAT